MDFRDEYKKEIIELSPDDAAAKRIREGVMKRLAEQPAEIAPKKAPLRLGKIAAIGAAACLVIGVTAVITVNGFILSGKADMSVNGTQAPNAAGGNIDEAVPPNNAMNDGVRPEISGINAAASITFGGNDCTVIFKGTEHRYSLKDGTSDDTVLVGTNTPPDSSGIFYGTDLFTARSENDGTIFYIAFNGNDLLIYDIDFEPVGIYIMNE